MKEAIEDLEEARRSAIDQASSSDEDCDIKKEKGGTRRIKKYWCKINCCGIKEKVDNCLCARLILAGIAMLMILSVMYTVYDLEQKRQARLEAAKH